MSTGTAPIIDRAGLVVFLGLLVGVVVSDQLAYRLFVVPRLSEWQSVPKAVWLIVGLPVVVAGLIGGGYLRRGQRLFVALPAAIATQAYATVAALLNSPGYGKSLALEAPADFWTKGLLAVAFGFVVLLFVGKVVRLLYDSAASA